MQTCITLSLPHDFSVFITNMWTEGGAARHPTRPAVVGGPIRSVFLLPEWRLRT